MISLIRDRVATHNLSLKKPPDEEGLVHRAMSRLHRYDVTVDWTGNTGAGSSGYRQYKRDHEITSDGGKPVILGSSDPLFRDDRTRWNPEELPVAALSACHRLSDCITFIDRGRIIDSMDKEAYLNRWRRLRLELPAEVALPALPGIIGIRQTGRLAVAIANEFEPDLPRAYEDSGARVHAVENMTLEEIFVANVEHSREEVGA